MKLIPSKTWQISNKATISKIRKWLVENRGKEEKTTNPYEIWRIKYFDATVIFYSSEKKQTLFITESDYEEIKEFHNFVDSIVGPRFVPPSKEFLIGFDETGKGEIFGHIILVGVLFPSKIFSELDLASGLANTRVKRTVQYWDDIFRRLDFFKNEGFEFIIEKIPPWHVDEYNINQLMDLTYQRMLSYFFQKINVAKTRIVIDDYGVGHRLRKFLNFLQNSGSEIVVSSKADEKYLESRLASLIAKIIQMKTLEAISKNPEYQIKGYELGSGNAGDEKTLNWLKNWWSLKRKWPWFVKRSFKTIAEIEGVPRWIKRKVPPLNEKILSREFKEKFDKGILDITSLALICSNCGEIMKSTKLIPYKGKTMAFCENCKKSIPDAAFTLRYYCGRVLPDTSIIVKGFLSKDLENEKFFENFTILLHPIVKSESDTPGGKKELERLAHFDSIGRVRFEEISPLTQLSNYKSITSIMRDEIIMEDTKKNNAILITADQGMIGSARAKNLFIFKI